MIVRKGWKEATKTKQHKSRDTLFCFAFLVGRIVLFGPSLARRERETKGLAPRLSWYSVFGSQGEKRSAEEREATNARFGELEEGTFEMKVRG